MLANNWRVRFHVVSISVFGRELGLMIYQSGLKSEGMNVVMTICVALASGVFLLISKVCLPTIRFLNEIEMFPVIEKPMK